jgi:hypothetical protein
VDASFIQFVCALSRNQIGAQPSLYHIAVFGQFLSNYENRY